METQTMPEPPAKQQIKITSEPESKGDEKVNVLVQPATNVTIPSTNESDGPPQDKIVWRSDDGLIVIRQLVRQAKRHPQSDYPCIVIQAFPVKHERVRRIANGGVELMPAHLEFDAMVDAINAVATSQGKGKLYDVLQRVAPKSKERKMAWKKINIARAAKRERAFNRWSH